MSERKFNRLKMLFGRPFAVGNGMMIYIPTIGDILDLEDADVTFYQTLNIWIANSTMYRLPLWEMGFDWNKISDYQLFLSLYKNGNEEVNHMLFGDIDISSFQVYGILEKVEKEDGSIEEVEKPILYNQDIDISISEEDHHVIQQYLRTAFNIFPKVEKAKGKATKQAIIDEERMNLEYRKKNESQESSSPLLPLVSACTNHPGFKYNLQQLPEVNFVQFMDSVQRLQVIEQSTALLRGSMGGFVDTSKINKEEFNFMREIKPQS